MARSRKIAGLLAAAALGTSLAVAPAASAAVVIKPIKYGDTCDFAMGELKSWMAVINELDPLGDTPDMDHAYDQMLHWQGQVLSRC